MRIINEDDEGIYCYYNDASRHPGWEITDREPPRNDHGQYFDILYYEYEIVPFDKWEDVRRPIPKYV